MKKTTFLSLALSLSLWLCTSTTTVKAQHALREISLAQQIEKSSLVIEGEIISKTSVWNKAQNNIVTINTIKVHKVFKGQTASTLTIITPGGKVDGIEQVVIPSLRLQINDVGVFTLHPSRATENKASLKKHKVYSAIQGFYKYDIIKNTVSNPFHKKTGISNNFYNEITRLTKLKFTNLDAYSIDNIQAKAATTKSLLLAPIGISFTPTEATAGTQTVLTINGSGFGNTKGNVGFRDADLGGSDITNTPIYVDALDTQVLTWSDTQITVEIPTRAGTGEIRITNNDTTIGVSSSPLTILFSLLNTTDGLGTKLYSANNTGHITWQMNTAFNSNATAKAAFMRAFETWRCNTNINWVIGSTVSTTAASIDGVNVITFDTTASPLPEGTLAICSYTIGACDPRTARDFVGELDLVFNHDLNDPNTTANESWYYGSDPNAIAFQQWDFESVALHELGHGHQIGHVIDSDAVMHYALSNFETQRTLSAHDLDAGHMIQGFSTSTGTCGTTAMTAYTGSCNLGVDDLDESNTISLYPNPSSGYFFIKTPASITLTKAIIYDISGRLISIIDVSKTKTIALKNASAGLYFINIYANNGMITKKIMIE